MAATAIVLSMFRIAILLSTTGVKAGRRLPLLVRKRLSDEGVPEAPLRSTVRCFGGVHGDGRATCAAARPIEVPGSADRVAAAVVEHETRSAGRRRSGRN